MGGDHLRPQQVGRRHLLDRLATPAGGGPPAGRGREGGRWVGAGKMWLGCDEPSDFDRMSLMPAASTTARTGPPAMTPVPGEAGFSMTTAPDASPSTWWGMVASTSGTSNMDLRADSEALAMAAGTSRALPCPTPTRPLPSPTTTTALNEKRRPPLTTLAPRRGPPALRSLDAAP